MLVCGLLALGCQPESDAPTFPIQVTEASRTSPALLLSEIQQAEVPAKLLDADFVLENRSNSPRTIMLAGKSCSCYGVRLDGDPWEVHNEVTIPPSSSQVLTFDVAPSAEAGESSWSVRLTSPDEPTQELQLSLSVHVYADIRLEPDALVATLPFDASALPDDPAGSPQQKLRLAIRQTWRGDEAGRAVPQITGIPAGWAASPPVVVEQPQQFEAGLWQQIWELDLHEQDLTSLRREVRLKVTPTGEQVAGRSTGEVPERPAAGVHRFRVSFENHIGEMTAVYGRFVLRAPPGITGPSVVHWGRLQQDESRTKRIILAASDERAFSILGVSRVRSEGKEPADHTPADEEGFTPEPRESEAIAYVHQCAGWDLSIAQNDDRPQMTRSLQFDLTPHQNGSIKETLVIETDHPLTPRVEIDLRGVVVAADEAHSP